MKKLINKVEDVFNDTICLLINDSVLFKSIFGNDKSIEFISAEPSFISSDTLPFNGS